LSKDYGEKMPPFDGLRRQMRGNANMARLAPPLTLTLSP
jgi:hypothetical protein